MKYSRLILLLLFLILNVTCLANSSNTPSLPSLPNIINNNDNINQTPKPPSTSFWVKIQNLWHYFTSQNNTSKSQIVQSQGQETNLNKLPTINTTSENLVKLLPNDDKTQAVFSDKSQDLNLLPLNQEGANQEGAPTNQAEQDQGKQALADQNSASQTSQNQAAQDKAASSTEGLQLPSLPNDDKNQAASSGEGQDLNLPPLEQEGAKQEGTKPDTVKQAQANQAVPDQNSASQTSQNQTTQDRIASSGEGLQLPSLPSDDKTQTASSDKSQDLKLPPIKQDTLALDQAKQDQPLQAVPDQNSASQTSQNQATQAKAASSGEDLKLPSLPNDDKTQTASFDKSQDLKLPPLNQEGANQEGAHPDQTKQDKLAPDQAKQTVPNQNSASQTSQNQATQDQVAQNQDLKLPSLPNDDNNQAASSTEGQALKLPPLNQEGTRPDQAKQDQSKPVPDQNSASQTTQKQPKPIVNSEQPLTNTTTPLNNQPSTVKDKLNNLALKAKEDLHLSNPNAINLNDSKKDESKQALQDKQTVNPINQTPKAATIEEQAPADVANSALSLNQQKFIDNEYVMILLKEDDVVLGELTNDAKMAMMTGKEFIKEFYKQEEENDDITKSLNTDSYIAEYYEYYDKTLGDPSTNNQVAICLIAADAFVAIEENNDSRLKVLINSYPELLRVYWPRGDNVFSLVIKNKNVALTSFLLNKAKGNFDYNTLARLAKKLDQQEILYLLQEAKIRSQPAYSPRKKSKKPSKGTSGIKKKPPNNINKPLYYRCN